MPILSYLRALNRALAAEMERDPAVCVFGEDIGIAVSNVTTGLLKRFGPERVIDMPISEQAFTSFATGAAMSGSRPVVEFQIPSLLFLVFEQIANQAHKFSLMTGGQVKVPVTYLLPSSGSRVGWAGQHSDHPYSLFAHVGVKTVVPATPADAYGLLVSAIRDDDPVIVFGPAGAMAQRENVDFDTLAPVPLGVGRVHRPGTDVTVVAVGHLVHDALAVADELAGTISVEVFDPRTLYPFDWTGAGGVAGAHRQARRDRRLQPDLRHRRRDPGHRGRGDAPDRPAETGHPAGRRGAAVRPRARPRAAADPRPAARGDRGRGEEPVTRAQYAKTPKTFPAGSRNAPVCMDSSGEP